MGLKSLMPATLVEARGLVTAIPRDAGMFSSRSVISTDVMHRRSELSKGLERVLGSTLSSPHSHSYQMLTAPISNARVNILPNRHRRKRLAGILETRLASQQPIIFMDAVLAMDVHTNRRRAIFMGGETMSIPIQMTFRR